VLVGAPAEAAFSLEWSRSHGERSAPNAWWKDCAARLKNEPMSEPPRPAGFGPIVFATRKASRTSSPYPVWLGWNGASRLGVMVAINSVAAADVRRTVLEQAIPSLKAYPPDLPTPWAIFGASFVSPAAFALSRWRLFSGDIAVEWSGSARRRLCARQVYPACIALTRRPLADWLMDPPFPERRRTIPHGDPTPWSMGQDGTAVEGLALRGRKAHPFPFHHFGATESLVVAVCDRKLDRLLMVQCDAPRDEADATIRTALVGMNWAIPEPGAA
jgi:hypothetical protein